MRVTLAACVAASILAGCGGSTVPDDKEQYFDNINPDPIALEGPVVLPSAELGETVQIPEEQAVSTAPLAEPDNAAISNTQDFGAVKEQETIASDAAKLAALKQSYEVVQPEALPQRSGGVNLASYAISQKQAVGAQTYRRTNTNGSNCSRYRNDPDGAQRAFLKAGGPEDDRNRLDPDGDGFACNWDPNVYRRLVQN